MTNSSHPILHEAYNNLTPRQFPSPPTHERFTVVSESDSLSLSLMRNGTLRSRDNSPAGHEDRWDRPRGPGHTPNLSQQSTRRVRLADKSAAPGDEVAAERRASSGTTDGGSDDEAPPQADGSPIKWSYSSGSHEGSFRRRAPRNAAAGSSVLAAAAASSSSSSSFSVLDGSGGGGGGGGGSSGFTSRGSAQRNATLAVLNDLQSQHSRNVPPRARHAEDDADASDEAPLSVR